jgi:hypothetical protein
MKFMLLILDDPKSQAALPPGEMEKLVQAHYAFAGELAQSGKMLDGQRLGGPDEARRVQRKGAGAERTVTDGPFPETKEALGWAKKIPLGPMTRSRSARSGRPTGRRPTSRWRARRMRTRSEELVDHLGSEEWGRLVASGIARAFLVPVPTMAPATGAGEAAGARGGAAARGRAADALPRLQCRARLARGNGVDRRLQQCRSAGAADVVGA